MSIRKYLLTTLLLLASVVRVLAADYKQSKEYLDLRSNMTHAFNDGDSASFFVAVKSFQDYLLEQGDLHAYYTQRCNEIIFLMNRQNIFEAYKLARQLSRELRERNLDKEMYMAINMMGHINRHCGNKEAAKQCFREVIERMEQAGYYESMPPIYMNIVNVEMNDDPEEALALIEKAHAIAAEYSPERVFDIETRRAVAYYEMRDTARFLQGYEAYQKGKAEGQSSVHGRELEVYYLAFQGKTDEAVQLAQEVLSSDDYGIISGIYKDAGRWREAYEMLKLEAEANDSLNMVILGNSMQGIQDDMRIYEAERRAAKNRFLGLAGIIVLLLLLILAMGYIVVSRRRHMRQLNRAYQHALESDNMKSAFIQNVSHEVRTPLNIISGFAQVLADPTLETSMEERRHMAHMMQKNTSIITSLVEEMLELSHNESTGLASVEDMMPVNRALTEILEDEAETAHQSIALRLESGLADDYLLRTNELLFKRIVKELLTNAIKNTEQGEVVLKPAVGNGSFVLAVEDTGCGIPKNMAENIFERFYKLDNFKVGLGLGLPLCRATARRIGGTVELDTGYSGGARFVVTLPI
ncbi:MAG: HAMP domain-containing histidine kinase [Prevotella sp.]|nr:HAMP domain-containing histidine kinase [Prevotella sp.]